MNFIDDVTLEQIKVDFKNGISLRKLENKYHINRKKISVLLRKDGIKTSKKYSDEMLNEASKKAKLGIPYCKIAKEYGVNANLLGSKLNNKKLNHTPERDSIAEMYKNGDSIQQIAKQIHKSTNYVYRIIKGYGIIDSDRTNRKYFFDEDIFDIIDTEEKAYWLGFLYADGCVNSITNEIELSLQASDRNMLEKFVNFFQASPSIPIKEKIITINDKTFDVCKVSIFSKKIKKDLVKHGCCPNKSLILSFPKTIPDNLMNHFLRGILDGDGCINTYKDKRGTMHVIASLTTSYEFGYDYEEFLIEKKIFYRHTKPQKTGKAYTFAHGGNVQCKKLFDYLYSNATIYLERKHNKFIAVFDGNINYDESGIKREKSQT